MAAGGKDNGAPGLRPHYHPNYYGAFVDVGLAQDAMIHISEISDRYVRDANEVVKVGQGHHGAVQRAGVFAFLPHILMEREHDQHPEREQPVPGFHKR